jgi:hypothetical protein
MEVHARQRAAAMSLLRARKLARSALNGRTDLARRVQRMREPMQAPGDRARRGGRRLAGPRSGTAIVVDDRMCAVLDGGREIAERAFDVGENAREVCGRVGVVSLHPQGMRHFGEAPRQAATRPGLRRRANRSKGVVVASGGSDAGRGRRGGSHDGDGRSPARWPQWALTPNSSRGPGPSAIARQIGQRNAGARTSGAGIGRPAPLQRVQTAELASAGPGRHRPCGRVCANLAVRVGLRVRRGTRPRARPRPRRSRDVGQGPHAA